MKLFATTTIVLFAALFGCAEAQFFDEDLDLGLAEQYQDYDYDYGYTYAQQDQENLRRTSAVAEEPTPQQKFTQLIDNVQSTIGVFQSGVGLAKSVINLFSSSSSEELTQTLTDQGYEHFRSGSQITAITMAGEVYEAFTTREIEQLSNIPSKHADNVKRLVREAGMVDSKSWQDTQAVFDIGEGGENAVIQVLTAKDQDCNRMSVVIIVSQNTFSLKPDLFVITKSKATMGGAFSSTRLVWKSEDAALSQTDLEFVSNFFLATAIGKLEESQSKLLGTQATQNCGPYVPLPTQCNPWQTNPNKEDFCGYEPTIGIQKKKKRRKKKKNRKKKRRHLRGVNNWRDAYNWRDVLPTSVRSQRRMLFTRRSNPMINGRYGGSTREG